MQGFQFPLDYLAAHDETEVVFPEATETRKRIYERLESEIPPQGK
jgi:hypothetical protein